MRYRKNSSLSKHSPLLDLSQAADGKPADFLHVLPTFEACMPFPVADNPVSQILGDAGQLREFSGGGGIQINFLCVGHVSIFMRR